MPEPIPSATVKTMLDTYWNASNVTEPTHIDINDGNTGAQLRFDLRNADYIFIAVETPALDEEPIGTWVYGNRRSVVVCEIHTKQNRQRLYDLMAEVRRVCHARMHSETSYQRVQFMGFTEYTDVQLNLWAGRVQIELVNSAILLET